MEILYPHKLRYYWEFLVPEQKRATCKILQIEVERIQLYFLCVPQIICFLKGSFVII